MNYIKTLQTENASLNKRVTELREGLLRIQDYCNSPKYSSHLSTMNPADVTLRISEVLDRDTDILFGAE